MRQGTVRTVRTHGGTMDDRDDLADKLAAVIFALIFGFVVGTGVILGLWGLALLFGWIR